MRAEAQAVRRDLDGSPAVTALSLDLPDGAVVAVVPDVAGGSELGVALTSWRDDLVVAHDPGALHLDRPEPRVLLVEAGAVGPDRFLAAEGTEDEIAAARDAGVAVLAGRRRRPPAAQGAVRRPRPVRPAGCEEVPISVAERVVEPRHVGARSPPSSCGPPAIGDGAGRRVRRTRTGRPRLPGRARGRRRAPVVVVQEWWGWCPTSRTSCDRFAAEGFVALAPDLYRGETTAEPDEAGELMMALNLDQAAADMRGAVANGGRARRPRPGRRHRLLHGRRPRPGPGAHRPDGRGVRAVVRPDPVGGAEPDWSTLAATVLGHYAEEDGFFGPDKAAALQQTLDDLGKDADLHVVPGVDHAFFNDTRPEVHDPEASRACWNETVPSSTPSSAEGATPMETSSTATSSWACGSAATSTASSTPTTGRRAAGRVDGRAAAAAGGAGRPTPAASSPTSTAAPVDEPSTPRRRRWLRAQVVGLHTIAAQAGRRCRSRYLDEVERCYGVRARPWSPEDAFAAAHRASTRSCPAPAPLRDRFIAWREAQAVPADKLEPAIDSLADDFRERTAAAVRPARRRARRVRPRDRQAVVGLQLLPRRAAQPGRRSTSTCPCCRLSLGHLVAHEAYPGHHTEHTRKEVGLVRRRRRLEETIFLVGTPAVPRSPRAWPTSALEVTARRAARAGRGRAPPPARHPATTPRSRPRSPRPARRCRRCAATRRSCSTTTARPPTTPSPTPSGGRCCPGPGREGGVVPDRPDLAGLHPLLRRGPARCAGRFVAGDPAASSACSPSSSCPRPGPGRSGANGAP